MYIMILPDNAADSIFNYTRYCNCRKYIGKTFVLHFVLSYGRLKIWRCSTECCYSKDPKYRSIDIREFYNALCHHIITNKIPKPYEDIMKFLRSQLALSEHNHGKT